jgi:Tfp pilus assembly ATPase PilU
MATTNAPAQQQPDTGPKLNLHALLKAMIENGASDLHITTGSPPQLRIDGRLVPLKTPPLSAIDTKQLCYSVLTDAQKHQFEEENELDLSFASAPTCSCSAAPWPPPSVASPST